MKKIVALTGGIACGKSLLEGYLRELGCRVLDADGVVHLLQEPGGDAYCALVDAFGMDILDESGRLDRIQLSKLVFSDEAKRQELMALVHPMVRRVFHHWFAEADSNIVHVGSIPLLYECGWETDWPYVVCIGASPDVQLARMMHHRNMTEDDARVRLKAQLPVAEKMRRANYVIWNNGQDPQEMRIEAELLLKHLAHI